MVNAHTKLANLISQDPKVLVHLRKLASLGSAAEAAVLGPIAVGASLPFRLTGYAAKQVLIGKRVAVAGEDAVRAIKSPQELKALLEAKGAKGKVIRGGTHVRRVTGDGLLPQSWELAKKHPIIATAAGLAGANKILPGGVPGGGLASTAVEFGAYPVTEPATQLKGAFTAGEMSQGTQKLLEETAGRSQLGPGSPFSKTRATEYGNGTADWSTNDSALRLQAALAAQRQPA